MTENNNSDAEFVESKFLTAGMTFSPLAVKSFTTKQYNRVGVKILDASGEIYFTTAAKIVKIFVDLQESDFLGHTFTVVQKGTYNGHPVLSVSADTDELNKTILRINF